MLCTAFIYTYIYYKYIYADVCLCVMRGPYMEQSINLWISLGEERFYMFVVSQMTFNQFN